MGFGVWVAGFRVKVLGFVLSGQRVYGLKGLDFRVRSFEFGVQDLEFRFKGLGFRV